jgi:biopolymer transport protein ExbB/TolQ
MAESLGGLLGFVVHIGLVYALVAWGRRIARERNTRAWWIASYLPIAAFLASQLGLLGTVHGLIDAFGAVGNTDPSHRAEVLSQGIAEAMWSTAIGLGVALVLYVGSIGAFLYATYGKKPTPR